MKNQNIPIKTNYQIWPVGKLPKEWQRPELDMLKKAGYKLEDPRDAVDIFEKKIAKYAGSKYAIAVDNCTDAIMLCLHYLKYKEQLENDSEITVPARCYMSIPMTIKANGFKVKFEDIEWQGMYQLKPTPIWDSAPRFTKNMYIKDSYQCLSFQIKKRLPIGKGGMILTDDEESVKWFRMASFEGRNIEVDQWHDNFTVMGWNMYMTPEDAARGILLFDQLPEENTDTQDYTMYPDLSTQKIFK
jgi:dTDP-4-amino-4,6-dideoxygalactose transaminase